MPSQTKNPGRANRPKRLKKPRRINRAQFISLIIRRRRIISVIVLALFLIIVIPQLSAFKNSLHTLGDASIPLVAMALVLASFVYAFAAELYFVLVKHPVRLSSLMLVQAATALASRLAPIGIGAAGLNALFLRRREHTLPESLAVIGAHATFMGAGFAVVVAVISTTAPLPTNLDLGITSGTVIAIATGVAIVIATLLFFDKVRRRIARAARQTAWAFASYRHQPRKLVTALCISILITLVYVATLATCSQALGLRLPFNHIFLIYTLSLLTGAATPTPGGIVGVEAGLASGFIAYNVDASTALAVALLYRLITYWVPLIPGLIALRLVQRRYFSSIDPEQTAQ